MNSLGKCTRDKRWSYDGEFHLKECEKCKRYGGGGNTDLSEVTITYDITDTDILHHKKVCRIAYDMTDVIAKSKTEPEYHPYYANESHHNKTLEHGGDDIFRTNHTPPRRNLPTPTALWMPPLC